jgi:putative intracellular protease/amidase
MGSDQNEIHNLTTDGSNWRKFVVTAAAATVAAATLGVSGRTVAHSVPVQESSFKVPSMHDGRRPEVAMLVHLGVTYLDLIAPHTVLAPSCNIHLVWKNTDLLETDSGIITKASSTFEDCPKDLDVLFVPGGEFGIMLDDEVLTFLADRGTRAKYVTSVCGGSVVLGAAGLLQGYEATSHWSAMQALPAFGAIPVEARVVTDRNRISGGGVTAGIDFGLVLLAEMLGEDIAKISQLSLEYDPAPPFDAGTPKKAGPIILSKLHKRFPSLGDTLPKMVATASKNMSKYTQGS